jgi:hypothetical protein
MAVVWVGLLSACAPSPQTDSTAASSGTAVQATPDSVSLEEIRAVIDEVGVAALFDRVQTAEPYLTDLFGVQALQPLSPEQIVTDLVPRWGTLVERDAHAITIDLNEGPRVTFRPATTLYVDGNPCDVEFARVALHEPSDYPAEAVRFRHILEESGLAGRYLLPNPYYENERLALARMAESEAIPAVDVQPDTTGFGAGEHAVILVGETHGGTEPYELARTLIQSKDADWLALEMISEDFQDVLDAFVTAPGAGPAYEQARTTLLHYWSTHWNRRGHEVTADPADNPYFRLVDLARTLGKRVYALDTTASYILFRFGEFPLGAATRDHVWASNVPPAGRGIVYGGSSHFAASRRPSMLTFLRERYPQVSIHTIGSDTR